MGKIYTEIINTFDQGISNDKRSNNTRKFAITKHLDAFTYPHKLVPYYKTEAVEDKTYDIVKFAYVASNSRLYGFGIIPASATTRIYYLSGTTWTAATGGDGSTNNRKEGVFIYYKDYLYMWREGTIMRYGILTETFTDNWQGGLTTATNVATPVHHSADDKLYFFADNIVHSWDNSSFATALTLPSNLKIVSACEYGNYLAIGCTDKSGFGKSTVFLWDRDSSLSTISGKIDFGEGQLRHLANLNNKLIGVMAYNLTELYPRKMLIKQANGDFGKTINEITLDANGYIFGLTTDDSAVACNSVVDNNKLYFTAHLPFEGDTRLGIWVVDEYGNASLDFIEEEATDTTGVVFQGIFRLGNTWWIAHSNDGSVNRTDDNASYSLTNPGIYETLIRNAGDSSLTKKLVSVTVMNEPLPTSASAKLTLKYKKDEETSWTTIFENTLDNSISHTTINIESTGATLPQFKEIQFRLESLFGVVPTGLKYKAEIIDSDIN